MKKFSIFSLLVVLMLLLTMVFTACSSDDDSSGGKNPPSALDVTFASTNEITGVGATVTGLIDTNKGYSVDQTVAYDNGFAYFKVTLPAGYTLSDYTKVDVTVKLTDGDANYKYPRLFAYAAAPTAITDSGINKIADNGATTGAVGTSSNQTFTLNSI